MTEQNQVGKVYDWLFGALKKNPEGLLLVAAGAVLLMRKNAVRAATAAESAGTRQTHVGAERGDSNFSGIMDKAERGAASVASFASNYAEKTRHAASEGTARITRQAQVAYEGGLHRVLESQPLIVPLAGLAAGAVVAALLPESDFEKQALGPAGEQITEGAFRVGDQLKETASKAAGTLKTAVVEHSLDPAGLKSIATEVTDVIRDSMSDIADRGELHSDASTHNDERDRG